MPEHLHMLLHLHPGGKEHLGKVINGFMGGATHAYWDLVGNMELLRRPLFPLVCHRADARMFEQQKEAVMKVAREQGGVIVTACVSPK